VVFPSAQDAVSAAVQAQRALFAYPWPEGEQVRVRMGVHTGSPMLTTIEQALAAADEALRAV
jgi:class 3 adenylate cyclase